MRRANAKRSWGQSSTVASTSSRDRGATNVNDIDWTTRKNTAFADHLLKTLGDMAINWRLLLAGLRYEISLGYRSLDPIYRVIAWSFNVAYAGVFPSMDWRGRLFSGSRASFAGKYISGRPYALTEVRGDWKWHKEVFDLRHFWKFLRGTCFKCKATKCPGPFQYVKLQNFENTPRLTTNEFFNMLGGNLRRSNIA